MKGSPAMVFVEGFPPQQNDGHDCEWWSTIGVPIRAGAWRGKNTWFAAVKEEADADADADAVDKSERRSLEAYIELDGAQVTVIVLDCHAGQVTGARREQGEG